MAGGARGRAEGEGAEQQPGGGDEERETIAWAAGRREEAAWQVIVGRPCCSESPPNQSTGPFRAAPPDRDLPQPVPDPAPRGRLPASCFTTITMATEAPPHADGHLPDAHASESHGEATQKPPAKRSWRYISMRQLPRRRPQLTRLPGASIARCASNSTTP